MLAENRYSSVLSGWLAINQDPFLLKQLGQKQANHLIIQ